MRGPDDESDPAVEDDDAVAIPVEDHLDLHAFGPKQVRSVVEAYLESAAEAGFKEVRLIHGRGVGVQRAIVQSLLARHPLVRAFADAPPARGGWGATIVALVTGAAERHDRGGSGEPG